jgi:Caudovirus prohead serine protease
MGFQCFQDEFSRQGAVLVRHLVSIRLTEVSPVAQPGYAQTSTAIPNLAGQIGEDPDDMEALAAQGELRSLFMRTDQQVTATPGVEPGSPALVEARTHGASQRVTPADPKHRMDRNRDRALNDNRENRLELSRRIEANRNKMETYDLQSRLEANRRKMMVGAVETRSLWWSSLPVPATATPLAPSEQ